MERTLRNQCSFDYRYQYVYQWLIKSLQKFALKNVTSDRGKEFACYKEIENMGIDFYFADPYSAWQRGSNENSNGLLREYYPMKSDLAKIEVEDLIKNIMELNTRPRKCLNYQTPFDIFIYELSLE
ncbi:IS30 family transposase [Guggenheimella bovis]